MTIEYTPENVDYTFEPFSDEWYHDFELLRNSAMIVARNRIPGLICEIGTRKGHSAIHICETLREFNAENQTFICIDPYGNIPYIRKDNLVLRLDYTNSMRDIHIPNLHRRVSELGFNFMFMNMEDTEFYNRYHDGVPVYVDTKQIANEYALVYVDGPHDVTSVLAAAQFFPKRMHYDGIIVFDDISYYEHQVVDFVMRQQGFTQVTILGDKASYRR